MILPDPVLGSSSRKMMDFGALYEAWYFLQNSIISAAVAVSFSLSTTAAVTASPHFSSGTPKTAASRGYYYSPISSSFYKPPLTLDWIPGPNMYTAMLYGASAQLDDSIYIIGGHAFSGITDTVEVFDTRSKQISLGTFLPIPREGTTAVTVNNKIYVIGGITSQSSQPTTLVQVYSHGPTGISNRGNPNLIKDAHLVGYPNPFNSTIDLKFTIPRSTIISLTVYDLQGREIKQLANELLFQGTYFFKWNGGKTT